MGVWLIGADTLAGSRFTVSTLAESLGCLLKRVHEGWFPEDPFAARFCRVAFRRRWLPDFMCPPPHPGDRSIEDELRRVRATPYEAVMADLEVTLQAAVPAWLRVPDLPERVADLLAQVWRDDVERDWPRLRRAFEADIIARTHQLSSGGLAAALNGMRPGMRWLGDRRLQINTADYPPQDIDGGELMFIPVTARRGWVAWDQARRYAIVYPCAGLLAESRTEPPPQALERLLGPVRAAILMALDTPKSTTHLVALTGHGLGSVGGHLRVLLDARLVRRRRSGRSVLYYRTETGEALADL